MEVTMPDAHKAILRRFLTEAFEKGNLKAVDELIDDNFVDHTPPPNIPSNKAGLRQTVTMFRSAFPDLRMTIEDIIEEGPKVAVRLVTHGTHKGAIMGVAPTGRTVNVNEEHFLRFADGKIAEHWGVEDTLGMMQQLGIMAQQGQAGSRPMSA
jgi:steroid delta-isomerase-like uncharacterized protein